MMKIIGMFVACAIALTASLPLRAYTKPDPVHSPKLVSLGGSWFMREADECVEVKLDRSGRAEMLLGYREVYIDRNDDYLFLTVKRFPHTYTYRMNPIEWAKSYVLELVAVKPDTPPTRRDQPKHLYTGIFRRMVDCQLTPGMQEGTVEERSYR